MMDATVAKFLGRLGFLFMLAGLWGGGWATPSATAQPVSYCWQDAAAQAQNSGPHVRSIYISEADGRILDICLEVPGASLSVSETGALVLLQREAGVDVSYFGRGVREGLLQEIGNFDIDYFRRGVRAGSLETLAGLRFDYFIRGHHKGRISEISNLQIDYFDRGEQFGKLRQIGPVSIDYSNTGEIETDNSLENTRLIVIP
ncbi:MAG: hypothetical protein AAGI45_15165 [Cyanobacteria bacterium P01_H01_bin.26]